VAAPQVNDIFVRLKLSGFDGIDKLKSSFRDLGKVTSLTDSDISSVRNRLIDFAKESGNTESVTKGLISAFQGLRSQAQFCGDAYTQLTADINAYSTVLRGSSDAIEKQREALLRSTAAGTQNAASLTQQVAALERLRAQTRPGSSAFLQLSGDIETARENLGRFRSEAAAFASTLTQMPGASLDKIDTQIQRLTRGMRTLRIASDEYLAAQQRLSLVSTVRERIVGRQNVRAAAEMYASPQYAGFVEGRAANLPLPNTTAGLNQELSELSQQLLNTDRNSAAYVATAVRMAEVQRQLRSDVMGTAEAMKRLDNAQVAANRRQAKVSKVQEYYSTQGPTAPGVGGYRDPETGAMIARGSYSANRIRVNEAQYAQPIGPAPFPAAGRQAMASMEQAYKQMLEIEQRAGLERVNLQAKVNQLHAEKLLEGLDMEGALRKKAFDQELADFDRRLEASSRRRARRPTGMQLTQMAGAAISGGIFGGPEGFIGGVAGGTAATLLRGGAAGVGGAFAGAAIGAQVGMIRQAGQDAAEYAAQIQSLRVALKGASTDQKDYASSVEFINKASKTYLTDLGSTTQNYTRLQASVRGAGRTTSDTQTVFKGLSSAVLATGGNAESLNAAMLAASQVFGKGKVSAEELRGQIGERLPGAFSLFAQSLGVSTTQLDKLLEQGKVNLGDFVNFAKLLSTRYDATAAEIGKSSGKASARFALAVKDMQLAAGQSLLPINTIFLELGTSAVQALTRMFEGTTAWQKAIGSAFNAVKALIGGTASLKIALTGLAGVLIPLGASFATVFALQGATATISALKQILQITKALLTVEKARAAALAIQGILSTAKGRAGLIGLGVAGAAAIVFRDQIGKAVGDAVDYVNKAFDSAFKTPGAFGGTPTAPIAGPAAEDAAAKRAAAKADAAAKRAATAAAANAADSQRLYEATVDEQIRLDKFKFDTQLGNIRKAYEYERDLRLRLTSEWVESQTGAAKSVASVIQGAYQELFAIRDAEIEARAASVRAASEVGWAKQRASASAMAPTSAAAPTALPSIATAQGVYIQGGIGPRGSNQYGPHYDIKRTDNSYFARGALDPYVSVNGRPLSSGLTDPRGSYGAMRDGGARTHTAWDYAFSGRAALSLQGGAKWVGNSPGGWGDSAAFMTPDGKVYRIIHGTFQPGADAAAALRPPGASAVASQQRRNVGDLGDVNRAQEDAAKLKKAYEEIYKQGPEKRASVLRTTTLRLTQSLREETDALRDQTEAELERLRLQREDTPELFIDARLKESKVARDTASGIKLITDELKNLRTVAEESKLKESILQPQIDLLTGLSAALTEAQTNYANQLRTSNSMLITDYAFGGMQDGTSTRIGEGLTTGVGQYVESLGTMKDALSQLANTGVKGLEDAIVSLTTTGTFNFREFANSIIKDTVRMIVQQTILRTILAPILGGSTGYAPSPLSGIPLFGGLAGASYPEMFTAGAPSLMAKGGIFATNDIQPFAMGGVVRRPTMFAYANGGVPGAGLMGEAGPEAIMPLRRGADGKLGVAGGGTTNITVNVSSDGTTSTQGGAGQSEQLGRVIAAAVRSEIVNQKRPGGLLS